MNETGDKATRDKEYPKLADNHHYFAELECAEKEIVVD